MARHILLSLLGLAFIWLFAVSLPFLIGRSDSGSLPIAADTICALGWVPMIIGGAIIIWCYGLFIFIGRGTPWPFDPPKKLVVAGPYRFVRNPMEGSFLLILLGEALLFRSASLVFYSAISFALLFTRQLLVDEPALRARFGPSYERYFRSVPRYIPRLSPYREPR